MRFPADVVEADLLDPRSIDNAVRGCDAIIHLGAGEKAGRETQIILNAAIKHNVQKFVHVSSAAVYGLGLPASIEKLQEDTRVVRTGELYADGKAKAEFAALRAARKGLPVVILRPQVVYGPGMRWSVELMQLLSRDEICILEDGGTANLIYIDDLVAAISRALESDSANGETFFITDGSPISWKEYILAHARLIGASPPRIPCSDVLHKTGGLGNWLRGSFKPLLPVLRTQEFRSLVTESPLMQATVFRAYLALRENKAVRAKLERMRNGQVGAPETQKCWNKHWISLQVSEARLSAARAQEKLGFRAQVGFAEGLRRSAAWFETYGLAARLDETKNEAVEALCLEAVGE
jgi:nucleoside-diphosphate-sugar epimerase